MHGCSMPCSKQAHTPTSSQHCQALCPVYLADGGRGAAKQFPELRLSKHVEAGEGARLALRIGGKVAPVSGDPVDAEVRVLALRRDAQQTGLTGAREPLGDCALVAVGGVEVLLNTRRTQAFGTDLFTQFGVDLAARRIVVVKSSQHFHAAFSKVASHILYADVPGTLTSDLTTLPFHKARPQVVASFRART